jgi:hypothetical protein
MELFAGVLFWAFVLVLAVGSWMGPFVLRRDASPRGVARYRRFVYLFALGFGLLPALTGQWQWSLLAVPLSELFARFVILRKNPPLG